MKKTSFITIIVFGGLFLASGLVIPRAWAEPEETIEIDSWTDLASIGVAEDYPLDGNYVLTRDLLATDGDYAEIMESGNGFDPIGNGDNEEYFSGTFDGDDHKINNLIINSNSASGLFESVHSGNIGNLTLKNAQVIGTSYVGALVGILRNGEIRNCHSSGFVIWDGEGEEEGDSFGGLIGYNDQSTIEDSSSSAQVIGRRNVGGLIGSSYGGDSSITKSFSSGQVEGQRDVGGLVGYSHRTSIINTYSWSEVQGGDNVGGLVGAQPGNEPTSIHLSYASGKVTGSNGVGGLVGYNGYDAIESSFSVGEVTGENYAAGLLGYFGADEPNILSSYWYDGYDYPEDFGCYYNHELEEYGNENCDSTSEINNFKGEAVIDLMTDWNFDETWVTVADGYPILRWQLDTTPPVFEDLSDNGPINLIQSQLITTNPYIIQVKPTDNVEIDNVKFWVDDNLLCIDTEPDESGIYSCSWDTSKYHSDIRVIAYDTTGNPSEELIRTATVDPSVYTTVTTAANHPATLPRTGIAWWWYLLPIVLIFVLVFKKQKQRKGKYIS